MRNCISTGTERHRHGDEQRRECELSFVQIKMFCNVVNVLFTLYLMTCMSFSSLVLVRFII